MYCSKCGKELREDAVFCDGCGTPQKSNITEEKPFSENIVQPIEKEKKKDNNYSLYDFFKIAFIVAPFLSLIFMFVAIISNFNILVKIILLVIAVVWIVSCHSVRKQMKLKIGNKPSVKWFLNNLWSAAAGIFVVLCAVCSFVLETAPEEPSDGAVATTTTIVTTTEPTTEALIEISAIKLIKEYQNNEIAFEKKYVGKTLLVSGVIDDISSAYGSNYISISDGDSWINVDCYLRSSEEDKAAEFNTGDYITIKGKCTGESWGDPQLSSCEIIK